MCLAVPVRIVELNGASAIVDSDGVRVPANVAFLGDVKVGDFVLVHAGFAIRKWSDADMREYEALLSDLASAGPGAPDDSVLPTGTR